MRGTMMDFQLTLPAILERAGKQFPNVEILSRRPDKSFHRTCYGEFYNRARKLSAALTSIGLQKGDRVASMMWNHSGHLEAFFGIPCASGILHTLNLRLHPHEIAAIANTARDRFLIVDDCLIPVLEKFRASVPFERIFVVPYSGEPIPTGQGYENYEELLASASDNFTYPDIDENDGSAMCFTSGTTGNSKGVVYSHRSLVLHTFAETMADSLAISGLDTVLPIAPMFHANAWGLPYTCAMTGAHLVLPGHNVDGESILNLIQHHRVTFACGVPTVWLGVLYELEKNPGRWKFDWQIRVLCGGTAPPERLIRALDKHNIQILHLWGMTETTPLATIGRLKRHMQEWRPDQQYEVRAKQGWPAPFVELRIMRPEDGPHGGEAPWDGATPGELEVRGPWVAGSYFEAPDQAHRWTADGWFKTGDVAVIDSEGIVKLVDRAKDLVKSGGEWISSVDLENTLMGHPAVREACVFGVPHPKWQERPIAVVVLKEAAAAATPEELRTFLGQTFAKWQLPDAFVFVDAIPRTSVGKFKKTALREQYANWKWD